MTTSDARTELQKAVENLSKLQPGNAALHALREALPDISARTAEKMLARLEAANAPAADPSMVMRELGRNFLGAEAWAKLGIDVGPVPPLPASITKELLDSPCPLNPESKIKDTHLLVLVPSTVNGEPYSAVKLYDLCAARKGSGDRLISDGGLYGCKTESWAKEVHGASDWVLIPKNDPDPRTIHEDKHFRDKNIAEQQAVHDRYYGEYREVKALELMTAALLNDLVNGGPRMLEEPALRCKEARDYGARVWVGGFDADGLKIGVLHRGCADPVLGRALARKI